MTRENLAKAPIGDEESQWRAEAREKALAEAKQREKQAVIALMMAEERAALRATEADDIVSITINVPPNMFVNQSNETGVVVDGKAYIHDRTYEVPRSLANDLNHLMFRANYNERSMGSPNREMQQRKLIDARAGKVIFDPRQR